MPHAIGYVCSQAPTFMMRNVLDADLAFVGLKASDFFSDVSDETPWEKRPGLQQAIADAETHSGFLVVNTEVQLGRSREEVWEIKRHLATKRIPILFLATGPQA